MAKDRSGIFNKRSELEVEDPIEVIRTMIEANDRKINYIDSQMDLVITYYKIKILYQPQDVGGYIKKVEMVFQEFPKPRMEQDKVLLK